MSTQQQPHIFVVTFNYILFLFKPFHFPRLLYVCILLPMWNKHRYLHVQKTPLATKATEIVNSSFYCTCMLLGHHYSSFSNHVASISHGTHCHTIHTSVRLFGCCRAALLPSCRPAAVHVAYHCTCCLLLSCHFSTVVQPCQQYWLSVLCSVSPSLCLPLFDYFATFGLLWWYHTALPVSYGLTTVMPVCHACC